MSIEHPYILGAATVFALPLLVPIARLFFRDVGGFADELGVNSHHGIAALFLDAFVILVGPNIVGPRAMHHKAHAECFIANSVKTDVHCEPIYAA